MLSLTTPPLGSLLKQRIIGLEQQDRTLCLLAPLAPTSQRMGQIIRLLVPCYILGLCDRLPRSLNKILIVPPLLLMDRLILLYSLLTLTWFITAHILEYTSVYTCRRSSPHLWWLTFGILSVMYIKVSSFPSDLCQSCDLTC